MRVLDLFGGAVKKGQEFGALGDLHNRLQQHIGAAGEKRNELCRSAVTSALTVAIQLFLNFFYRKVIAV